MLQHESVLHPFIWPNNISLCGYTTFYISIHHLMGIWGISTFRLLWIMLQWTFVYDIFFLLELFFTMRVFFPLWVISHQFLWVILSVPISYLRESEILWKVLHSEKVLQFSASLLLNVMTAEPSHEGMTLLPGKRGKMKDKHKEDLSCP